MRRPSTRVSSSRVACGRSDDDVAAKHRSRQHRRAIRVPFAWCRAPSTGGRERRRRLPPERRPPLRSRPKLSSRQREAGRREVGGRRAGCAAGSRSGQQWMSPGRDNGKHALVSARGGTPWPARPECGARGNGSTTLAIAGGRGRGAARGKLMHLVRERKRARRAQAGRYLRVQLGSAPPCLRIELQEKSCMEFMPISPLVMESGQEASSTESSLCQHGTLVMNVTVHAPTGATSAATHVGSRIHIGMSRAPCSTRQASISASLST